MCVWPNFSASGRIFQEIWQINIWPRLATLGKYRCAEVQEDLGDERLNERGVNLLLTGAARPHVVKPKNILASSNLIISYQD
jgi:hypothetical protein